MMQIERSRPRTVDTRTSDALIAIKRRIMHLIHDEAMRSVATELPIREVGVTGFPQPIAGGK